MASYWWYADKSKIIIIGINMNNELTFISRIYLQVCSLWPGGIYLREYQVNLPIEIPERNFMEVYGYQQTFWVYNFNGILTCYVWTKTTR